MDTVVLTIGKIVFAAVAVAVGRSLLRESRGGDGLGLPALATAAIFVGGLGLALIPIGTAVGDTPVGRFFALSGEWAMRGGLVLLSLFVWRVFRPGSLGGALGGGLCIAGLVGTLCWDLRVQQGWWPYDLTLPSAYATQLAIAAPFAWSCIESALGWRRLQRQLAVGLGATIVRDRFALWTIATAAFVGVCLLAIAAGLAAARGWGRAVFAAQILRGALLLVNGGVVWFGIFRHRELQGGASEVPAA